MKRRILTLLISLSLLCTLFPAAANAHGSAGIANNGTWGIYIDIYGPAYTYYAKKAYGGNAYTSVGCAWFACARAYELTGIDTVISSGASWYKYRYAQYGYTRGQEIREHSLVCYSGHTSFVEAIRGDQVLISEGGWPAYANDCCIMQVKTIREVESKSGFLGYVYLPDTAPTVNITTDTVAEATIGKLYFQSLFVESNSIPVWSITEGSLPLGLTLSTGGILRGTPMETGTFTFTVTAANAEGEDSAEFTLNVGEAGARAYFFLRYQSGGELLDSEQCAAGTEVDLAGYVPEREGYRFLGWYADAALTEPIESITVNGDCSVYAAWEAEERSVLPFTDLTADNVHYENIRFLYESGIMGGTSAVTFSPGSPMTRQMLWVVLARLQNAELSSESGVYAAARQWAIDNGVSDGTGGDAALTRQQLVTMLYRAEGEPSVKGNLSVYHDEADIAGYAAKAMLWAWQKELIGGYNDCTIRPGATATRAQAASILARYASLG